MEYRAVELERRRLVPAGLRLFVLFVAVTLLSLYVARVTRSQEGSAFDLQPDPGLQQAFCVGARAPQQEGGAGSSAGAPLLFIENAGQFPSDVAFQGWSGALSSWWFNGKGITISMYPEVTAGAAAGTIEPVLVTITFEGAAEEVSLEGIEPLGAKGFSYVGNDPERWQSEINLWGGMRYADLYPGIDVEVRGVSGQLWPRLILSEGAQAADVRLRIEGASVVQQDGDFVRLGTAAGDVRMRLMETVDAQGERLEVGHGPTLESHGGVMVLDTLAADTAPVATTASVTAGSALLYSSYLGFNSVDGGRVALDQSGRVYIAGMTIYGGDPTAECGHGEVSGVPCGVTFVVRLKPDGTGKNDLDYFGWIGGSGEDLANGIVVDANSNAYVVGTTTSQDFPHANTTHIAPSMFAFKLNDNALVVYSKVIDFDEWEEAHGIAIDPSGVAYLIGTKVYAQDDSDFLGVRLFSDGQVDWPWAWTYDMADTNTPTFDRAWDIEVAADGHTYFTGYYGNASGSNAIVGRLTPDGNNIEYWWFNYGVIDNGNALVLDSDSAVYFTGYTSANAQTADAFAIKISDDFSEIEFERFLGGSLTEYGRDIALMSDGSIVLVGGTSSADFFTTQDAFDSSFNYMPSFPVETHRDAFVAVLDGAGDVSYSTFFGGGDFDYGTSVAVGADDAIYFSGWTNSDEAGETYPITTGAFQPSYTDEFCNDPFIAVLSLVEPPQEPPGEPPDEPEEPISLEMYLPMLIR